MMSKHRYARLLDDYFFVSYLIALGLSFSFYSRVDAGDLRTQLFTIAVLLSYGLIYLMPAILSSKLLQWLLLRAETSTNKDWRTAGLLGWATLVTGLTETLVFADIQLLKLYDFHFNGFIWNLLTTPGGLESMGMSASSNLTVVAGVSLVFAMQCLLFWALWRLHHDSATPATKAQRVYIHVLLAFVVLSVGERVAYGISHVQSYHSVLIAANRAYIDADYKASLPFARTATLSNHITTRQDAPTQAESAFFSSHAQPLHELMLELGRFSRKQL